MLEITCLISNYKPLTATHLDFIVSLKSPSYVCFSSKEYTF